MANRKVQLYKYIKLPDLGWRYCKVVFYPNNRVKPHAVVSPRCVSGIAFCQSRFSSLRGGLRTGVHRQ